MENLKINNKLEERILILTLESLTNLAKYFRDAESKYKELDALCINGEKNHYYDNIEYLSNRKKDCYEMKSKILGRLKPTKFASCDIYYNEKITSLDDFKRYKELEKYAVNQQNFIYANQNYGRIFIPTEEYKETIYFSVYEIGGCEYMEKMFSYIREETDDRIVKLDKMPFSKFENTFNTYIRCDIIADLAEGKLSLSDIASDIECDIENNYFINILVKETERKLLFSLSKSEETQEDYEEDETYYSYLHYVNTISGIGEYIIDSESHIYDDGPILDVSDIENIDVIVKSLKN